LRGSFVFDPNRCTGCSACELACSIENRLGTDRSWRSVLTFNERAIPGVPLFHLSLACNHCETAACMEACPALAYERDPASGAVLIREDACIGCRYCSWACPYGAPRFEPDRGVMEKCTFCSHRLADGRKPACAALCPTGALDYETLGEDRLVAQIEGMPRTELGPSIRILPLERRSAAGLTNVQSSGSGAGPPIDVTPHEPRIQLSEEWSLAAFTLLLAVLFALLSAATVGAREVSPLLFAVLSALAAGLSLAHLGRPGRAWRAVLGVRRSPVSREVLGFGLMASLGTASLAASEAAVANATAWSALAAGLLALVSADRVYRPVHHDGSPGLHSAGVLLTGLFLAALMAGSAGVALLIGGGKLLRYVTRTRRASVPGPDLAIRRVASVGRIGLGFALPAAAWVIAGAPLAIWTLFAVVLGEAIDRVEFYSELEIVSPARQQRLDLDARLAEMRSSSSAPAASRP
jgi:Fe-S-cluster-containing dehydrogenase component/DMSO reductase anchor subunit